MKTRPCRRLSRGFASDQSSPLAPREDSRIEANLDWQLKAPMNYSVNGNSAFFSRSEKATVSHITHTSFPCARLGVSSDQAKRKISTHRLRVCQGRSTRGGTRRRILKASKNYRPECQSRFHRIVTNLSSVLACEVVLTRAVDSL